jgi:hypothetical protein
MEAGGTGIHHFHNKGPNATRRKPAKEMAVIIGAKMVLP